MIALLLFSGGLTDPDFPLETKFSPLTTPLILLSLRLPFLFIGPPFSLFLVF